MFECIKKTAVGTMKKLSTKGKVSFFILFIVVQPVYETTYLYIAYKHNISNETQLAEYTYLKQKKKIQIFIINKNVLRLKLLTKKFFSDINK